MHICPKNHPGFSIVEILMFLMVVFSLVVVLLSSAVTLNRSRSSNLQQIATGISTCEMERLRNLYFTALPTTGSIDSQCNQDLNKLGSGSTAQRVVADFAGDENIKKITLVVTWTEKGANKDVTMETLISKYGL